MLATTRNTLVSKCQSFKSSSDVESIKEELYCKDFTTYSCALFFSQEVCVENRAVDCILVGFLQ